MQKLSFSEISMAWMSALVSKKQAWIYTGGTNVEIENHLWIRYCRLNFWKNTKSEILLILKKDYALHTMRLIKNATLKQMQNCEGILSSDNKY